MDCCSKIDFADFKSCSKDSSLVGLNLVPKFIIFYQISCSKVYLKQSSSFDIAVVSKFSQNVCQTGPKMLYRNCGKRPWGPSGHIKPGFWSQRQRPTLSRRSFWPYTAPNLAPFPPSASCSHIITGAILLVNHNVNFYNGSRFLIYWSEHTRVRSLTFIIQ